MSKTKINKKVTRTSIDMDAKLVVVAWFVFFKP